MFDEEELSLEGAKRLDNSDALRGFRDRFNFPIGENGEPLLYFTGNSLGLQPKSAIEAVAQEMDDWRKHAVEAHFAGHYPWKDYHEFLTEPLAKIVGAKAIEVVAMNTLTNNLNTALISFYRPEGKRRKIMIEGKAFPSDIYSVKSHIKLHGNNLVEDLVELWPREGEHSLRSEDILEKIDECGEELATVMLGGVNYFTGQLFDMREITARAHSNGAIAGFDLAHAAGNAPLKLHEWDVDFAVWCSYKYLNAGPGATAGLFIHERHAHDFDRPRLAGWWGHDSASRFLMESDFQPMPGAEGWQNSNPAILPMACLRASLEIFSEAGMEQLREKSVRLTEYFETLMSLLGDDKIEIITPSDPEQRGAQLSIRVNGADRSLFDKIREEGAICDWREPDVIRAAPVPLYNSYEDVYRLYSIIDKILV